MIAAGTVITCPKCGASIAVAKADILSGMRLDSDLFSWLGRPYIRGQALACYTCGEAWARGGIHAQIHTESGWLPRRLSAIQEAMNRRAME